jgi:CRP/FNR family cyclic AMP-dependent transcriptional regulator
MSSKQKREPIDVLAGIKLFENMNREELGIIANLLEVNTIEASKEIFQEGDPGGKMLVIGEGTVEVQKNRSHGSGRVVIARFESGGVIGEMSLIDGMSRSATAVAITPTTYYNFSKASLESLFENHKDISIKLLNDLAMLISLRLRNTSGWFADVF